MIADGELAEVRLEPNGANTFCSNTSNGYNYKQYVNYYLIPKEKGSFKHIIEKFKDTMIKLQVMQPVGYVKLCWAHNVIKSTAEWTARDFVC